jgi:hypothetical protein
MCFRKFTQSESHIIGHAAGLRVDDARTQFRKFAPFEEAQLTSAPPYFSDTTSE